MPQSEMAGCSTCDLYYSRVTEIAKFLDLYKWLLDMRIVDFFTDHHWDKLPRCWQHSLRGCDLKRLCLLLFSSSPEHPHTATTVWPLSLLSFAVCCQMLSLQRESSTASPSSSATTLNNHQLPHSKHIKPKKQHEIKHLSEVVARLADQQKCYNVIDVGSGHGHLARHLAFHHQLNVTTIESDNSHFKSAVKFDREVVEELEKKARRGVDVGMTGVLNHVTHHIRPNICDREVTELLQHCVGAGANSVGGAGSSGDVLLVGLHTCGDLGPTMLRMFTTTPHIVGLISVGCCYMKLTCATEPHPPAPIGYPLSSKVKSLQTHTLSYESRELACHALELYRSRVLNDSEHLKIHCYRAVVQTILIQVVLHWHNLHRSQIVVAKRTSKLPFEDYARAILASFYLPTELDIDSLEPSLNRWAEVVVMYMLRLAIAPCVESIILLDRLLYLKEQGYNATVMPLFDPSISPRNFVIIAHKLSH